MFPYMPICVLAKLLISTFDMYVTYRQRRLFKSDVKPSSRTASLISPEKFQKSQRYCFAKSTFQLISSTIQLAVEVASTYFFLTPTLWSYAGTYFQNSELKQTLALCTFLAVITSLMDLPFSIVSTFIIEARFGFNRTTVKTFAMDLIKDMLISAIVGYPVIVALYYVLTAIRDYNPLYIAMALWGVVAGLMIVMLLIYPTVIAPLFNNFTPMEDGELKTKVEKMASQLNFPLDKIYVIDGSKRSSHSNAFIFGFMRKYICIYDTLLEQNVGHDDQIVAVLCHEIGHWHHNHLTKSIIKALIHVFIMCFLYGMTVGNEAIFESFGFVLKELPNGAKVMPVIIGLLLFNQLLSPIDDVLQPIQHYISRKFEFQADAFANQCGMSEMLGNALVVMSVANLSNMVPEKLYSAWNYSHPTLLERLDALDVCPKLDATSSTTSTTNKKDE